MRKILLAILLLAVTFTWAAPRVLSDSAQIYLLTCTPGNQVWSKYGHTGIRVCDEANQMDIVFNYGIFSLMEEGFYLKFIKGDTYYQLGIEPYSYSGWRQNPLNASYGTHVWYGLRVYLSVVWWCSRLFPG